MSIASKASSRMMNGLSQEEIMRELKDLHINPVPIYTFRTGNIFATKLFEVGDYGCFAIENGHNLLILRYLGLDMKTIMDGDVDDHCIYSTLAAGLTDPLLGFVVGSISKAYVEISELSYSFFTDNQFVGKVFFSQNEKIADFRSFVKDMDGFNDALLSLFSRMMADDGSKLIRSALLQSSGVSEEYIDETTNNIVAFLNRTSDYDVQNGLLVRTWKTEENTVLPEGVISIGKDCFYNKKIKTVQFPNSVRTIEEGAFRYCDKLESVSFPSSLREIGSKAFVDCVTLKELIIPEGVEIIGSEAFRGCHSLEKITLPKSLKKVDHDAFEFCSQLKQVCIPVGIQEISDGCFSGCVSLSSVELPIMLKKIGNSAFEGCSIHSLILPDTLELIGEKAFSGNDNLVMTVPRSVTSIGKDAFDNSYTHQRIYVERDSYAEEYCIGNKIKARYHSVPSTNGDVYIPVNPANIIINSTIERVDGQYHSGTAVSCYSGVSKCILLPSGIMIIGDDCGALLEDSYDNSNDHVESVVIPEGTQIIKKIKTLYGKEEKQLSVYLPSSIISIDSNAFGDLSDYEDVDYKVVLFVQNKIGEDFAKQYDLEYYWKAFDGSVSDDTESICYENPKPFDASYYNNPKFFIREPLAALHCDDDSWHWFLSYAMPIVTIPGNYPKCGWLSDSQVTKIKDLTVSEGIVELTNNSFENAVSLSNIVLPSSLRKIDDYVFNNCKCLKELQIPENVISIGAGSFTNCTKLKRISIPASIEQIGRNVFDSCYSVKELTIYNYTGHATDEIKALIQHLRSFNRLLKIVLIGDYDKSNEGLRIQDNIIVKYIGLSEEVLIPEHIIGIAENAFAGTPVRHIVMADSVKHVDKGAFKNAKDLISIEMSNSIQILPEDLFSGCSSLIRVKLPNELKTIHNSAFSSCSCLADVFVPATFDKLTDYSFGFLSQNRVVIHTTKGPLAQRAKKLGYSVLVEPDEEDIMFTNLVNAMEYAQSSADWKKLENAFLELDAYKGAATKAKKCAENTLKAKKAEEKQKAEYEKAKQLFEKEEYGKATEAFLKVAGYADSKELIWECHRREQEKKQQLLYDALVKNMGAAASAYDWYSLGQSFKTLGAFDNSKKMSEDCFARAHKIQDAEEKERLQRQYQEGIKLIEQEKYDDAILCFQKLNGYKDAEEMVNKSRELKQEQNNNEMYKLYIAKMDSANSIDQWQAIGELFSAISAYKDAEKKAKYCFTQARDLQNKEDEAKRLLEEERIRKEAEERRANLLSELDKMELIVNQNSGLGAMFGEKARKRKEALSRIEEIKKLLETI